ncbi:hypothetical protein BTJ68_01587 [Hortaea werneckii EXF-2000]|uniref:RWD domain-containing protein n=1 Tax=Hortaea werneckii EXF-2000 TaxID=1157616 RepID=A0A1Z5TQE3_HORWE|nr:hypothetical protein BTJ68_01587 [Hortaea werneckii EXF-2000]
MASKGATPLAPGLRDDAGGGENNPPFLKLPPELRTTIYRYVVVSSTPIHLFLGDVDRRRQMHRECKQDGRRPLLINVKTHPQPLALTCRTLHSEVRPIYVVENNFCLTNLSTMERLHVDYITQFRRMMGPFAKKIKKVNIDYRSYVKVAKSSSSDEQIKQIWVKLSVLFKEPEDETPDPILILTVRYPEAYPDEAPELDITQPHNAPKHPHLNLQEDKARLLEALQPTIEESLGMAMVFTLVSTLKDSAELLISERQQAIQAEKDMEAAKAEEEENKKFEGQKVTRETFLAWREGFQKEMVERAKRRREEQEAEDKKKRGYKPEEKKMTGKQLWESGMATKNAFEDDEDEEGDDVMEGMRNVKVSG